jgi:hypothetical protein
MTNVFELCSLAGNLAVTEMYPLIYVARGISTKGMDPEKICIDILIPLIALLILFG